MDGWEYRYFVDLGRSVERRATGGAWTAQSRGCGLATLPPALIISAGSPSSTNYRYQVLVAEASLGGVQTRGPAGKRKLEPLLNELAAAGWEVLAVCPVATSL